MKRTTESRMMNPFTPNPSCEDDGSAEPLVEPAIQFTLKSMAFVITSLLVGGKTAHHLALSQDWLLGGLLIMCFLGYMFFTIPRELFDLLTN